MIMDTALKDACFSILRSVLIVAGSAAAAKGYIHNTDIELYAGAGVTVLTSIWGALEKFSDSPRKDVYSPAEREAKRDLNG